MTIAGQSAGGLSVLAHFVSGGSHGLFQRAIVQSGAFALTQRSLVDVEAAGQEFADTVGCAQNTADCVHHASVTDLVDNFGMEIPGVVDGAVLTESIGTALANGRFARVPILNGITHDEERLFVDGLGLAVSGAAEYPPGSYSSPEVAFSTLVSDAKFACPALRLDRLTSTRVPTFAYQFNDGNAPVVIAPPGHFPAVATHDSELPYLFDQPNTPFPATLDPDQQTLAASMRAVWTNFAAGGNASSASLLWPSYTDGARIRPLNTPQSTVESDYESTHHCAFWAAG